MDTDALTLDPNSCVLEVKPHPKKTIYKESANFLVIIKLDGNERIFCVALSIIFELKRFPTL